jgi:hypothetical protein
MSALQATDTEGEDAMSLAMAPATPVVPELSGPAPIDGLEVDSVSGFTSPAGADLDSAEWQIARDADFGELVLSREIVDRTGLSLAAGVLQAGETYWIRTRHHDTGGGASQWSDPVMIRAADALPGDNDGDGTADDSEMGGPADADGNGVDDGAEGICDLRDAVSGSIVGLASDAGPVECLRSLSPADLPSVSGAGAELPYGLFSFRVGGLRVDPVNPARVVVRVYLPEPPVGPVVWYKFDPATGDLFELPEGVTLEGRTAFVELVDGGFGDFDGVVNGVIVDPSGPGILATSGTEEITVTTDGGSSSIGLLLPGLMAFAGALRRRAARRGRNTEG